MGLESNEKDDNMTKIPEASLSSGIFLIYSLILLTINLHYINIPLINIFYNVIITSRYPTGGDFMAEFIFRIIILIPICTIMPM